MTPPDLPPLSLPSPETAARRKDRPPFPPFDPSRLKVRGEKARVLAEIIQGLSGTLQGMSDDQRRAVFFKLEHERPIALAGTGLKPMGEPGEHVTLAVPRDENLDRLQKRVEEFGKGPLKAGRPPHPEVDRIETMGQGIGTDRLSDGLFGKYSELVKSKNIICEIEIISLMEGARQQAVEIAQTMEELNREMGYGVHGHLFEHEDIKGTRRVVLRCTGVLFKKLVEDSHWFRKIAWFEERPSFQPFLKIKDTFSVQVMGKITPPPADGPVVCVIDSGITPENPLLKPVCKAKLFKSFLRDEPNDPHDACGHGSGVASLVAYNVLSIDKGATNTGKVWVVSARITTANNVLEEKKLFSVLLREVVEHYKPKGVRIFNLSVADPDMRWNVVSRRTAPRKSWVARTIDRLSREYDVVFVTCTGNILCPDVNEFLRDGKTYPEYFSEQGARILDPGQAALALTVGSIAPGTLVTNSPDSAMANQNHPSPFTRCGPGIRKEIKPELVDLGGNYAINSAGTRAAPNIGLNVVMASHQVTPAIAFSGGTSFSAPRAAHKLALVLQRLAEIGVNTPSAALLKAFLVNSATYRGRPTQWEQLDAVQKNHWLNVLGYGFADADRAGYCETHSSILYYEGVLDGDEIAFFEVPVPAILATAGNNQKRITVTVAFTPEVQRWGLDSYLGTAFKWRMFRGNVPRAEIIAAMSSEDSDESAAGDEVDEAKEDEDKGPKEIKFDLGVRVRSRGTIQHDYHDWTRHSRDYSKGHYTLAVAAYEKWKRKNPPAVPYAVVVRIEDYSRSVPVYAEVKGLLTKIPVRGG